MLSKFPTNTDAVVMVTGSVLPLCVPNLPVDPPSILTEVQMNALEAFSQLDIQTKPSLIEPAINLIALLWSRYPSNLPAACNIKHLAQVLNASLQWDIDREKRTEEAIKYGQMFVTNLMLALSDGQLVALEAEGVFKSLRSLLHLYDEMSEDALRQIVVGVGMFTEIKPLAQTFLEEDLHSSLLFAAQKYPTHSTLQQLIWRLFLLLCARDHSFAKALDEMGIISAVVVILKTEGSHLTPLLQFLTACCQIDESRFIPECLYLDDLMHYLLGVINTNPESPTLAVKDIKNSCDFISFLFSKCSLSCLPRLLDLDLVSQLEVCAGHWPVSCILPACIAIEGLIKCLAAVQSDATSSSQIESVESMIKAFYSHNHHLFLMQALADANVYSNPALLDLIYLTLQKLLKMVTPEALDKLCSRDFLELYVVSFIRDTLTFPDHASRIVFVSHYFVFQMKQKEAIERLRELNFHTPVVDLVRETSSLDVMCSAMGLLSCLIGKYFEFLKDVKPFLEANVPGMLLDKANKYGRTPRSQFGDDFSRILLNLTAEKEQSLQLYNEGFLDQLLEMAEVNYVPVVKRCIFHAIGNIALGGQSIKEVLYTKKFHTSLLGTLHKEAEKGDPSLLSACCRVLHILAAGDAAKRLFVENDCVDILLKIMKTRRETPEVCWRPLGLLSSLGFMAVANRRYILTRDVMEAVVKILNEEKHGKILSYTMLVFLAYLQMDGGTVTLRQMAIEDRIREVTTNSDYQKQATDLERWGCHVLEKQNLYTFTIPQDCTVSVADCRPEDARVSDWPPTYDPIESGNEHLGNRKLLPLDQSYLDPQTPVAIELTKAAKEQLTHLGLNPDEPLFRLGRVYGSTYGWCSNCDKEGTSYEMVIRPLSMTPTQYQHLIDNGWYRRGGVKMFRMIHNHSLQCCDWETRVHVNKFDYKSHKSYRKVLRRMPTDRLTVETKPKHFSKEAFDLYNSYHIHRHEKPQKSEFSYCEHVVDSPIANETIDGVDYGTFHQLYRLDGKLVAVGIIDVVPKGMVSIYMWYDISKEIKKYSFGVYSALKEIEFVQEMSRSNPTMQFYYLQGWNKGNPKLSYKARYEPEDFYCPGVVPDWVRSEDEVERAIERVTTESQQREGGPKQENTTPPETAMEQRQNGEALANATGERRVHTFIHHVHVQNKYIHSSVVNYDIMIEMFTLMLIGESNDDGENPSGHQEATNKETEETDEAPSEKEKGPSTCESGDTKEAGKDKKKCYPCEAIDNDRLRHRELTGSISVDVSKIVVCLNYSQYMCLGDVFTHFQIPPDQRSVMEKRFTELFLGLSPELTTQLVIDLKACHKEGSVQISEHEDVGIGPTTPTTESMPTDTGKLVV